MVKYTATGEPSTSELGGIDSIMVNGANVYSSALKFDGTMNYVTITDDAIAAACPVSANVDPLVADGMKVFIDGKEVAFGTSMTHDFTKKPVLVVKFVDSGDTSQYTVFSFARLNMAHDVTMDTIKRVGWFAARCFEGDLDGYSAGGLALPLGGFRPRFVINVQVDNGYTGYYDLENNVLKVYASPNTEATANQLTTARYSVILME